MKKICWILQVLKSCTRRRMRMQTFKKLIFYSKGTTKPVYPGKVNERDYVTNENVGVYSNHIDSNILLFLREIK
jgi:hypothetical protein